MVRAFDYHLLRPEDAARYQVAGAKHVGRVVLGDHHERRDVDLGEAPGGGRIELLLGPLVHREVVDAIECDLTDKPAGVVLRPERRPYLQPQLLRAIEIAGLDRGLDRRLNRLPPVFLLL